MRLATVVLAALAVGSGCWEGDTIDGVGDAGTIAVGERIGVSVWQDRDCFDRMFEALSGLLWGMTDQEALLASCGMHAHCHQWIPDHLIMGAAECMAYECGKWAPIDQAQHGTLYDFVFCRTGKFPE